MDQSTTLQKILDAGMEEFQEKGFRDASLRQIVKNAGVTTGAFYGYFSSKEALFASIVEPHAAAVMGAFHDGADRLCRPAQRRAACSHGQRIQRVRGVDDRVYV